MLPGARRGPRHRPPRRRTGLQGSACSRWATGPRSAGPRRRQWLDERGYDSTLDYLRAMSIRVLEETGLLPHLNPGVMSWEEISRLKPVAPSMGMMLETTVHPAVHRQGRVPLRQPRQGSRRCGCARSPTRAGSSFRSPRASWSASARTLGERAESIMAIRKSHKAFGHVQEVIVQNFLAKDDTAMRDSPDAGIEEFLRDHRRHAPAARPRRCGSRRRRTWCRARECLGAARRGRRRLGRGVAADPRPRQPRAAVAEPGRPCRDDHRRGRLRAHRTHCRAAAVRAGRCSRGSTRGSPRHVARARRPGHRAGPAGHRSRSGCRGRSRTSPGSRRAASTCTPRSTPTAATPRPAAIWAVRSATGRRSASRCLRLEPAPERVDTDVLAALRAAERDPAGLLRRRVPGAGDRRRRRAGGRCRAGRCRCAATPSATTSPTW